MMTALLEVLFPPSCAACGQCGREPFCRVCEEALVAAEPFEVPGIDRAAAVFEYGGPVADAIRAMKYGERPDLGRVLGLAMQAEMQAGLQTGIRAGRGAGLREVDRHDLAVVVPLSRQRLRRRGFNQSLELARGAGIAVDVGVLIRAKDTVPQVGLSHHERHRNVVGAFAVTKRRDLDGARVIVIDDVTTTGATLQAAAAALLKAGACSVDALTLARAEIGTPGV